MDGKREFPNFGSAFETSFLFVVVFLRSAKRSAIRSERESAGGKDTLFRSAKANDTISPLIFTQVFLLSDVRELGFGWKEQLFPWKRDGSNGDERKGYLPHGEQQRFVCIHSIIAEAVADRPKTHQKDVTRHHFKQEQLLSNSCSVNSLNPLINRSSICSLCIGPGEAISPDHQYSSAEST